MVTQDTFSRISKVLVDSGSSLEEADSRRRTGRIELACGEEIRGSRTLQAAFITAAATAGRCFPGSVEVENPEVLEKTPSPFGQDNQSLWDEVRDLGLTVVSADARVTRRLLFGSAAVTGGDDLRVSFDGWIAAVGPAERFDRLGERERSPLAGVLSGAQAVAELFFSLTGIHAEASLRVVARSLWRPDLDVLNPEGVGPTMDYLPAEFWISGLGHLGQAYGWTIGLLPFSARERVHIVLNDFDRVVEANVETGLLTRHSDINRLKTRIVANWLEERGFETKLVERAFDEHLRRQDRDPRLALFGFDGNGPRWATESPGFEYVIDTGLGGARENFDTIATFTFPHPSLTAATLWPSGALPEERGKRGRQLAASNAFYQDFGRTHRCGEIELAGTSVAVPFVGAAAASFTLAEAVRSLLGGIRMGSSVTRLSTPSGDVFRPIAEPKSAPLIRAEPATTLAA
jgi:hypothetical protein